MKGQLQSPDKLQYTRRIMKRSSSFIGHSGFSGVAAGLFFLCCISCKNVKQKKQEEKFDKIKWVTKNEMDYPYRDKMLKDLIANYKLPGVKKDELVNLLGPPGRIDNGYLFYTVAQERLGFWPLHTKSLVIKLAGDSTVEWVKIHE